MKMQRIQIVYTATYFDEYGLNLKTLKRENVEKRKDKRDKRGHLFSTIRYKITQMCMRRMYKNISKHRK